MTRLTITVTAVTMGPVTADRVADAVQARTKGANDIARLVAPPVRSFYSTGIDVGAR
jgi:hypothetical protein